nr:hypothetical protein [uncultured Campylobacter sp.]
MNEIASAFSKPRNDGILNGILNEIASVALLPRNDAGNSRIPINAKSHPELKT